MKNFTSKVNVKTFKKLIIAIILVIVIITSLSGKVSAKDADLGGKLLSPICDLFLFLGDGANDIMHSTILGQEQSTITVDMMNSILKTIAIIAVAVLTAVVIAVAIVLTAGAAAAAAAAIGVTLSSISVGTVLLISVTGGVVAAAVFSSNVLPENLELPIYQISPQEIFSNKLLLFDVDFFNPKGEKVEVRKFENGEYVTEYEIGEYERDSEGKTIYNAKAYPIVFNSSALK